MAFIVTQVFFPCNFPDQEHSIVTFHAYPLDSTNTTFSEVSESLHTHHKGMFRSVTQTLISCLIRYIAYKM
jgi:hypothetical protein